MNSIITIHVDRTFLYLVAIYAIHGILLHVSSMHPQLGGPKMNWSIVTVGISNSWERSIDGRNSNNSKIEARNDSRVEADEIAKWSNVDSDHNHVRQESMMFNELSYQSKLPGTTINYSILSKFETSYVTVMSCGSTILKNMSPAVLGIILGCMVFLFTDNINIP